MRPNARMSRPCRSGPSGKWLPPRRRVFEAEHAKLPAASLPEGAVEAIVRRVVAEEEANRPAPAAPQISEAQIEESVLRVLATMTDDTVRRVVVDVAEQLVREEIEKIKDTSE